MSAKLERQRLNEGLLTLSLWCFMRAQGQHDIATTLSMLERKSNELRDAVKRAAIDAARAADSGEVVL